MSIIRTVSLFGLAGLGLAVTGCGGDSGGSGGEPGFGLSWDLQLVGGTQTVNCDDAGTPTVNLDTEGANNFKSHDTFPCATMTGTSSVLPRGTYQVTVSLENAAKQVVSATQSTFSIVHGGVTFLPPLTFDIQSFNVAWTITKANMPATCDQAGAKSVKLITMLGDGKPMSYMFPCSERVGDTTAIPVGTYLVQAELLDGAGNTLSTTPTMSVVVDDKTPAQLPPIGFILN